MSALVKITSYGESKDELEIVDEGDHVRVRVREPTGKASIFLSRDGLLLLAEACLLFEATLKDRGH